MGRFFDLARVCMSPCPPKANFFLPTARPMCPTSSSRLSPAVFRKRHVCIIYDVYLFMMVKIKGRKESKGGSMYLRTSKCISQAQVLCTEQTDFQFPIRRYAQTVAGPAKMLAHGTDEPDTTPTCVICLMHFEMAGCVGMSH